MPAGWRFEARWSHLLVSVLSAQHQLHRDSPQLFARSRVSRTALNREQHAAEACALPFRAGRDRSPPAGYPPTTLRITVSDREVLEERAPTRLSVLEKSPRSGPLEMRRTVLFCRGGLASLWRMRDEVQQPEVNTWSRLVWQRSTGLPRRNVANKSAAKALGRYASRIAPDDENRIRSLAMGRPRKGICHPQTLGWGSPGAFCIQFAGVGGPTSAQSAA